MIIDPDNWQIPHLSISQILAFKRNPYFWALCYILKIPQRDSPVLKYGRAIHKTIEQFLKNEKFTENSEIIAKIGDFLAYFLEISKISGFFLDNLEHAFKILLDVDLPEVKGIIDYYHADYHQSNPIVIDHKTAKNNRYSLKPYQLKEDLQVNLYAYYLLQKCPNASGVFVQHNHIFKEIEGFGYSRTFLSTQRIFKAIEEIKIEMRKILYYYKIIKEQGLNCDASMNLRQCKSCKYAYGGCPYKDLCFGQVTLTTYLKDLYGEKMEPQQYNLVDLHEAMKIAREFYSGKSDVNKFELRELIADSIVAGLNKREMDGVIISYHLLNGNDPEYAPVLNRLKEFKLKTFVEVK